MEWLASNLRRLEERIAKACQQAGRLREEIAIVAVTKGVAVDVISLAVGLGLERFGENRVQEAVRKIADLAARLRQSKTPTWHMIGHLQTNKVRQAVEFFDVIESIDSIRLAEVVSREATRINKPVKVLLEVNSSGEASKFGFSPIEVMDAARRINDLPNLSLGGLMTVGPLTSDKGKIEAAFATTYDLFVQLKAILGDKISVLSMGMSDDLELAIKHGSTELRIGTAIFGPRSAG